MNRICKLQAKYATQMCHKVKWVIFTSANSAKHWFFSLEEISVLKSSHPSNQHIFSMNLFLTLKSSHPSNQLIFSMTLFLTNFHVFVCEQQSY